MSFIIDKLRQDYIDAMDIDKHIVTGQIRKEEGVLILYDFIDYIRGDIASLDEGAWERLREAETKLREANINLKKKMNYLERAKDAAEKREAQHALLREDYKCCKAVLFFIQNLCTEMGWF